MPPAHKTFLLADDDADDADIFCEALSRTASDAACQTAENGQELFHLLSKPGTTIPDIIFLDINMPIMNGCECLRQLKENTSYSNIPTIMYSTSSAKKDIDMAYRMGATLFLTKPEDIRELAKILGILASTSQESFLSRLKGFENIRLKDS